MIRRRRREVVRDGETADEALDRLIRSGCRRRSVHREGRGRRIWRTGGGFAGSPVRSGVSPGAGGTFFPIQGWCRKWRKMDFAGKELYGVPLDKENNPASRNGFWNGQVNQFESGVEVNPILVGLEGMGPADNLGQVSYLSNVEDVLGRAAGTML